MSGQFEQRRLARASYQLDVLDAFCGKEQLRRRAAARVAWRELQSARRRHEELQGGAEAAEARLAEVGALAGDTPGVGAPDEDSLRSEWGRLLFRAEWGPGGWQRAGGRRRSRRGRGEGGRGGGAAGRWAGPRHA